LSKRAIAVIIAGFLTVSIAYSIRYAFGMLLPEMIPALGITKTQAGLIIAAYFIIYTICTPVLGALSDHYSYRLILVLFMLILGLGALLMASVSGFIQAGLFFSVAAFGHAACWAPVMVLVQKWVPDNRRGTALSFVAIGAGTGIFIWGILLPVIVRHLGWAAGWVALGVTAFVTAFLNFILVRNPVNSKPKKKSNKPNLKTFLASYHHIFLQSPFWIIGIAYLLVGFSLIILFSFLPVYARESLGMPYIVSTRFISIIAVFGIIGQLGLGSLSDKVGRIRVMVFCSATMAIGSLGIVFAENVWSLYFVVGLYGFGYGAVWPVYAAVAADIFSRQHTGGIIGLWTLFLGIGSLSAPVISGWIIDSTGSYTWIFLLATLAGLLSALILLFIPKTVR
jgi:MFS family permease